MTRFETAIAAAALALVAAGCHDPGPPRPATKPVKGDSVKTRLDQKSEAYVITGESDAPKAVTPTTKPGKVKPGWTRAAAEPPKPKEPTFTAAGEFEATKEKGKESAIRAAVEKLRDHLLEQRPPINEYPTVELVQKMIVPHPGASEADKQYGLVTEGPVEVAGKEETRYKVEIALRVEPEHVRELRARERSSEALWVLAGLAALAGVVAVFFRIDAWTKGYLTSWLVLGTIGAGALLLGLWWWAK